jgi:5-methylcytosine-specific restriction protein A
MPSRPCNHPTCCNYVPRESGRRFCDEHAAEETQKRAERHRHYDQHQRDQDAKKFYNSAEWQRARAIKLARNPVCEHCNRAFATTVHHRIPLAKCTPAQRLDQDNLKSCCHPCHSIIEAEIRAMEADE